MAQRQAEIQQVKWDLARQFEEAKEGDMAELEKQLRCARREKDDAQKALDSARQEIASMARNADDEKRSLRDNMASETAEQVKEERERWVSMKPKGDERFVPDENCYRTGIVKKEAICKMMLEQCTLAKNMLLASRVKDKQLTS